MTRQGVCVCVVWLFTSVSVNAIAVDGPTTIRLLPAELTLSGPEATHRLLVEQFNGSDAVGPAASETKLVSDDPAIARIDGHTIVPLKNGTTTVRIEGASKDASSVAVTVRDMDKPFEWSFRNHVEPVLSRQGCNSGACHGALAGKGGFKLSLRGYDPERDFFSIVEQQSGRRIEPAEPPASLLLTKPTMAVPHKGGLRLQSDSWHYRVVAEWIAAGANPPKSDDPQLSFVEVLPTSVTLRSNGNQPLLVRAHYSDGRVEDVTSLAKFTSSNEAVATVDEHGLVKVVGPGAGAVTAWFSSKIAIARMTVPYEQEIDPTEFTNAARRNFVDDLVLNQLRRLNLKPSPRARDEVFIRRAFIDTIGTLPTSEEVTIRRRHNA